MDKNLQCLVGRDDDDASAIMALVMIVVVVMVIVAIVFYAGIFIGGFHSLVNYGLAFKHNVCDSNRKITTAV